MPKGVPPRRLFCLDKGGVSPITVLEGEQNGKGFHLSGCLRSLMTFIAGFWVSSADLQVLPVWAALGVLSSPLGSIYFAATQLNGPQQMVILGLGLGGLILSAVFYFLGFSKLNDRETQREEAPTLVAVEPLAVLAEKALIVV
jgi:hypothetical protein